MIPHRRKHLRFRIYDNYINSVNLVIKEVVLPPSRSIGKPNPLFPMNPNNSSALPLLFLHQPNTNRASSLVRQGLDRCEQKLQEHPYLCGHKACYRCTWHIGQPINTKSHVVCNTILFQVPGTRSGYKYLVRARCDMCTCDTPKFWSRSSVADPLTLPSFQSYPFQYISTLAATSTERFAPEMTGHYTSFGAF